MRERDVERHLVTRVKALGGEVRKLKWIGRRGAPDRVVMLPGAVLHWVETKRPGGEAEAHQAREHARMLKMGQRVLVLDTVEKIDEVLG
jgi:hypothetical protein